MRRGWNEWRRAELEWRGEALRFGSWGGRRRPRSEGWNGEDEIWAPPEELFPAEIFIEGVVDLKNAAVAIAEAAEVGGRKIEWAGGGAWVGDAKDEVVFVGELDGGGADDELLAGGPLLDDELLSSPELDDELLDSELPETGALRAIADLQAGWFTAVFHVLWWTADGSKMGNGIFNAQSRVALDHGMRTDPATSANFYIGANN